MVAGFGQACTPETLLKNNMFSKSAAIFLSLDHYLLFHTVFLEPYSEQRILLVVEWDQKGLEISWNG